jgi:5-methylcytosine-specific restriction protein A
MQERQARLHALRDPAISALYDSPQWQVLRAQVVRDAGGKCQWPECGARGVCVDHRTPHRGDRALFFNRNNLWLLCKPHHDRKTVRFDGGFGNARKPLTTN